MNSTLDRTGAGLVSAAAAAASGGDPTRFPSLFMCEDKVEGGKSTPVSVKAACVTRKSSEISIPEASMIARTRSNDASVSSPKRSRAPFSNPSRRTAVPASSQVATKA